MRFSLLLAAVVLTGCTRSTGLAPPTRADSAPTDSAPEEQQRPQSAEPEDAQPAEPGALTADGWGPLRVGVPLQDVVAAFGEDANPEAVGGPDPEQCDEFHPSRAPEGMLVMIEEGRLARVSMSGSEVKTDGGFGVGDTASDVKAAYGARAVVTPHTYADAPAKYITVWQTGPSGPDARGLVYEVGSDGRVSYIHAGGPSIEYVEGCL